MRTLAMIPIECPRCSKTTVYKRVISVCGIEDRYQCPHCGFSEKRYKSFDYLGDNFNLPLSALFDPDLFAT